MPLDRKAARRVLTESLPADPKWGVWVDGILDALEACVTPRLAEVDVRLVGKAEAKLAQVRALLDEREQQAEDSVARTFYGDPFPALITASSLRDILDAP